MRGFCLLITLYVKPTNSSGLELTGGVLASRFRFKRKLIGWQLSSSVSAYGAMDEAPEENVSQSWSELPHLNPVWRPTVQVQLLHPGLGRWQLPTSFTAQVVPAASQHWKGEGALKLSPSAEYLVTERQLEQLPIHSSKVIWTQDLRGGLVCLCPWGPLKNHHMNYRKRAEGKVLESTSVILFGKHQSRLEVSRNHKDT